MVKNSSFLRKFRITFCEDSANFFAILRIWVSKMRSESEANDWFFSAKRSEANSLRFRNFSQFCEFAMRIWIPGSRFIRKCRIRMFRIRSTRCIWSKRMILLSILRWLLMDSFQLDSVSGQVKDWFKISNEIFLFYLNYYFWIFWIHYLYNLKISFFLDKLWFLPYFSKTIKSYSEIHPGWERQFLFPSQR